MRHRPTASETPTAHADDLFRSRLESQIDLRHPLAQLAARMPWAELESALASTCRRHPLQEGGRPCRCG